MSVTPQPQTQDQSDSYPWTGLSGDTRGDRVEEWFERAIWHNSEICSHCFARLRTHSELERNDWGHVVEETEYHDAAVQGYDLEDPPADVPSVIPIARQRTTCGECGSVGGRAMSDAMSEGEAVDRVPALVERLRELGHAVEIECVYSAVRQLKSNEDYTDNDKRAFAAAAAVGIKHG